MVDLGARPFLKLASAIILVLSLGACSNAPGPEHLMPILPSAGPALEVASPAARDALTAGLRSIAEDAPRTRVTSLAAPPEQGKP